METIKGRVQSVNQKEKGYGIKIEDTWYNAFNECPVQKGDYVLIDSETMGRFHNIKKIQKIDTEPEEKKAEPIQSKDDDIHLQVCLYIASEQLKAPDGKNIPSVKQISAYARDLKKEVWG